MAKSKLQTFANCSQRCHSNWQIGLDVGYKAVHGLEKAGWPLTRSCIELPKQVEHLAEVLTCSAPKLTDIQVARSALWLLRRLSLSRIVPFAALFFYLLLKLSLTMTKRMPMLVHRDSETPRDDLYMLRQGAMHGSFTASSLPELKSSVLGSTQPKITQQQDSCPPPISFKSSFDRFGIQNPSTHQCRMLSENGPVFGSGDQADSSSQQYDTLSFGHPFQMIHGSLSLQNTFNFEHSHVNPSQLQHNEASNYPECFGNTAPGAVQGYEAQNMPHGAGYGDLSRNYLLSDPLAVNTEKSRSTTPLSVQNDDLVDNEESREEPPYNKLIYQCLKDAAPDYQRQLQEIYEWFRRNTNKGQDPKLKGWQNSIRHNLSMNDVSFLEADPV